MTRATVLIPTFDHASTLALTVESALNQHERDLEVLIVGDGVTTAVRDVALRLVEEDRRVRFLDFPKGPHHGEIHRHTAIRQSQGEIIVYLCDDDLLLPGHVGDMSELLRTNDIVQSLNGHIGVDAEVQFYTGDLADPAYVARLCDLGKEYNFVSITGTAHTREFYDRAAAPWETTPAGVHPDRHQWRRMLLSGEVRGATSPRMTAISFPTHQGGREDWTPQERAAEIARWAELVRRPDAQEQVDRLVAASALKSLAHMTRYALELQDGLADAERRFATVTGSRWWRLGRRLRPGIRGREV
ncbi:MAG: hypothetical protein JWP32_811 [Schumannella sp.]|nr:hypothetical protein [Schumannella sp.]